MYQRQLADEIASVIALAHDPASIATDRRPAPVSPPERLWHRLGRAARGGREEQT